MRPALPACLITLHELCEPGAVGRMGGGAVEGTVRIPSLTKGAKQQDRKKRGFGVDSEGHHPHSACDSIAAEDKDANANHECSV